jgi:hypothetical protein
MPDLLGDGRLSEWMGSVCPGELECSVFGEERSCAAVLARLNPSRWPLAGLLAG